VTPQARAGALIVRNRFLNRLAGAALRLTEARDAA
jgi:hypothetical protein